MCLRVARTDWFDVEFQIHYEDRNKKIRPVISIRRMDGIDISDGEYLVTDELGEHVRRWKKWNGKWQLKWRKKWNR